MADHTVEGALTLEPRRGGSGKAPSDRVDTEVPALPKKRRFPKEYKLSVLKELDQCRNHGEKGLILRREGLYSTTVSYWRKWRLGMGLKSKSNRSEFKNENARLKRENIRLKVQLERAQKLLELQKKMAEFVENLEKKRSEENPCT